jgi:hypothetical protein
MAVQATFGTQEQDLSDWGAKNSLGPRSTPCKGRKNSLLILLPGFPEGLWAFGTDEFLRRDPTTGDHAASYHSPHRCGCRFNCGALKWNAKACGRPTFRKPHRQ